MASPGQRRRLVTIQALTESKGPSGRPVETWAELTRAWMQREEVSGSEHFTTDKVPRTIELTTMANMAVTA